MKVGDEMIKKLWIICLLLTFSAFVSISCQNVSSDDAATEINSNDQRGRTKNAFKIVSSVSWIAESVAEDKILEASLEKLKETPVSSEKASRARLIVRNVTDNRIIYEEPGDDFPESVSKIDYPVNRGYLLLVKWGTASGGYLKVYSVSGENVKEVFNEGVKGLFTVYHDATKDEINILTSGVSPEGDNYPIVERYVWNGERFTSRGQARYEKFTSAIEKQFE
jgi:hypothetical protein